MRSGVQGRTSKLQGLYDKFVQLFQPEKFILALLIFFKLLAGIRQLIGEGKLKKSYGQQAANQNARASNEGD